MTLLPQFCPAPIDRSDHNVERCLVDGQSQSLSFTLKAANFFNDLKFRFIAEGTDCFVHDQHTASVIESPSQGDSLALPSGEAYTSLRGFWLGRNAFDLQMADIRALACVLKSDRAVIAVGVQI